MELVVDCVNSCDNNRVGEPEEHHKNDAGADNLKNHVHCGCPGVTMDPVVTCHNEHTSFIKINKLYHKICEKSNFSMFED